MEISYFDRKIETARREDLTRHQTKRTQVVLSEVLATNPFYRKKLREAGFTDARDLTSLAELTLSPFTRKLKVRHVTTPSPPIPWDDALI